MSAGEGFSTASSRKARVHTALLLLIPQIEHRSDRDHRQRLMSNGTYFIQITSQGSVGNTIFIMFANMLAFIKMCTAFKKDSW